MDLRELYQQVIIDHNKNPRNFHVIEGHNRHADGHNPLCGDKITVYLEVEGDVIKDISFQGSGCAISQASASMMTANLKGKPIAHAEKIFTEFHEMVTTDQDPDAETLGKLRVFAGVREFPSRVKCATLAWHTMHTAVKDIHETVSTECPVEKEVEKEDQ